MRWWHWRRLTKRMANDGDKQTKDKARLIKTGGGNGDHVTSQSKVESSLIIPQQDFIAVHKVLELEMLREKIINFAMRNANESLNRKELANLRLVGKSWLASVSRLLQLSDKPLCSLTLTKDNSLNGTPFVASNGKLLDTFVTGMDGRSIPTFRLNILKEFFQYENYDSLYNCLKMCGQGLLDLELEIPKNGGTLPCVFPKLSFPILHRMTVKLLDTKLVGGPPPDFAALCNEGCSRNVTDLLQFLLRKTPSLKELTFPFNGALDRLPDGMQFIALPQSITTLGLCCRIKGQQPELICRNQLSNLTTLTLRVASTALPEGMLTRIFDNLRNTLRHLSIFGISFVGPLRVQNFVTFPVMDKLETLTMYSINSELESELLDLSHYFPKLHTLHLNYQTRTMFHKWTSGFQASGVVNLSLLLVDDGLKWTELGYHQPVTLENMQRAHLIFPGVTKLTLSLTGRQTCGLKYLFMEMKQLTYLKILETESEIVENSDRWDSILTGLPKVLVTGIRENPELLEVIEVKSDKLCGISLLTALKTLELKASFPNKPSLISDFTFGFALNKMSGLKNLKLEGRFKASEASKIAWKTNGRFISYAA